MRSAGVFAAGCSWTSLRTNYEELGGCGATVHRKQRHIALATYPREPRFMYIHISYKYTNVTITRRGGEHCTGPTPG
eukprot:4368066-Prymnesium_polylepis.1